MFLNDYRCGEVLMYVAYALHLLNITDTFKPPRPASENDPVTCEMSKLKLLCNLNINNLFETKSNNLKILFHNVQSLSRYQNHILKY